MSNTMAYGGIVRNSSGNWVKGFMHFIGVGGDLATKLLAILSELQVVWAMGARKVWLEANSKTII